MKRSALYIAWVFLMYPCARLSEGSIVLIGPVSDLRTGNLESTIVDNVNHVHDPIHLIRERSVVLINDLAVDGTQANPMGPGGLIPAGTEIQSWILHFDMFGREQVNTTASGAYDFGLPILGLIFTQAGLDATDALLGNPETIYPTGVYYRDSNDSEEPSDEWSIVAETSIHIAGLQNQGIGLDQIRVLTAREYHAPEPTSIFVWSLLAACLAGTYWRRHTRNSR